MVEEIAFICFLICAIWAAITRDYPLAFLALGLTVLTATTVHITTSR